MNASTVFKRFRGLIVVAAAIIALSSCGTDSTGRIRSNISQDEIRFPKLKNYQVALAPLTSRRSFYAGEDVRLVFQLRNMGSKRLVIYEWRLKESENLRLYYAPYHPGLKELAKDQWHCLRPPSWGNRSTLTLMPKTAALIDVPLPFIKEMDPSKLPLKGKRFVMFAELNLESINARSGNFLITVK